VARLHTEAYHAVRRALSEEEKLANQATDGRMKTITAQDRAERDREYAAEMLRLTGR
jgi:hypothetical protein